MLELALQTREGVETRDAQIQDRLYALLLQPVDDIGGNPGFDGSVDGAAVALVDEHGDRPPYRAADLEHPLEHIAARVCKVDENDVRIDRTQLGEKIGGLFDSHHPRVARLEQTLLENGGARRSF